MNQLINDIKQLAIDNGAARFDINGLTADSGSYLPVVFK